MLKILIIEDDPAILRLLQRGLTMENYHVDTAADGETGLKLFQERQPDLVDGMEVCQRIRQKSKVPILILTAKDAIQDRVEGLDAGADDYLVKPFNLEELLARIRALLRRTEQERQPVLQFEDVTMNTSTREVYRGERKLQLTKKEYQLLELFLRHPRQVLTREMIFDRIWGYDFGGESNVLEVYVRYLRQKMEQNGEPRLIYTVRGIGYVLREPA